MVLLIILGIVGAVDLAVLYKLWHAFRLLNVSVRSDHREDTVPTVSICISARDETHAMTQCLERVVATDYPKLEVIVLDDGSRDNTSLLIKSFAHAGVRFVEGKPLPDGWLGKNYAQSILAQEASGKLVFFMDVDTLIDRFTVARSVAYMQSKNAKMMSIIPIRNDHWQTSTLMATMRHFWTLMRFRVSKPRAAANAWLIERSIIQDELKTDQTLPMSVQLETTVAQKLAQDGDYRLVMSSKWLGLSYEKRWSSQVETSIRLLYPQCGRHLYNVLSLMFILSMVLIPYGLLMLNSWAVVLVVVQYGIAYYYLTHVWARYRIIGALLLPVTIVQEILLLAISAYRYNFGVITWKGRPITSR
jgi:cellulose synthase/poly-beta-1,6-N-acetylglucosamine synthase-like glycosyltransferase